ncbi:helix-turn-helix domain-containing protein [Methylomicrobium album]|uniref:Putative transcriptional regulator n=1 Tax=Methylomicrobium album BG8 TaxID=686340 RepID=H8GNT7_METAL|nr:helix-turn-helix transcriptional regulator [Methylomicrobium album]EIC30843.1 putative transcriptional regulator [Methylomicrobium album BG8]
MPSSLHNVDYQIFRSLLVQARVASGLTQMQIAEKLGKPQSYISKYERGERRLDFPEFIELADILEIDVAGFVSDYRAALAPIKTHKARRIKGTSKNT